MDGAVPMSGLQRLVTLPAAPESARQARRFVTDVAQAVGADEFLDVATLLTSELVTNGIVHAHTELRVVVEATSSWLRVEVVDGNPMLPMRRDYTDEALTGRGLEMVELLADDFGMQPLGDGGKRVWFRLGSAAPAVHAPVEPEAAPADAVVTVRLGNLPVTLYAAWQEHADAILREATIVALGRSGGDLPEEYTLASHALGTLAGGMSDRLPSGPEVPTHQVVDLPVARVAVPWFAVLRDVLRGCNDMAAAGDLLVPPSLPEIQAVRRWVCDEIGRQGQGLPARPWSDPAVDEVPLDALSADAVEEVRTSATAQIAADRWNRIIAVSESAASLLGWSARELEGRRLVTIIPPALRDRHVAGFTRQMLGGPPRLIGKPVDVPALRRDGTELPISLLIDRRGDARGRTVFVATLTLQGRPA